LPLGIVHGIFIEPLLLPKKNQISKLIIDTLLWAWISTLIFEKKLWKGRLYKNPMKNYQRQSFCPLGPRPKVLSRTLSMALIHCLFDYSSSSWYAGISQVLKNNLQVIIKKKEGIQNTTLWYSTAYVCYIGICTINNCVLPVKYDSKLTK
jgi:hypothetical protein